MRFFVLELAPEHVAGETGFLTSASARLGKAPTCETCGGAIGPKEWLPPYEVELQCWNTIFGDIAFGDGDELLVSSRFKTCWEEAGLRGLQGFEPVNVVSVVRHKHFDADPPEYFRVTIARDNATIDQKRSDFEWKVSPVCPTCRLGRVLKRWKRVVIDLDTWSGNNIFLARGLPGVRFADEAYELFRDTYGITNSYLVPIEQYSCDFYPWEART